MKHWSTIAPILAAALLVAAALLPESVVLSSLAMGREPRN